MDSPVDLDILQKAIFRHQAMPIHAHEQPPRSMDHLFVEYSNVLDHLDSSEWQIVFGGRGAGKTHLLRVFQERSMRGAISQRSQRTTDVVRSLPVYVDAQTFVSGRFPDDDERRAHACFREFLEVFGEQLMAAVTALDSSGGLYAWLKHPNRKDAAKQALTVVREIVGELDQSPLAYPYDDQAVEEKHDEETRARRSSSAGAGLGIDPSGLDVAAGARLDRELDSEQTRRRSRAVRGTGEPRWHRIRDLLDALCKALDIERIDILIDNWTALDIYGTSLVQPYFGHLLKKSLKGVHTLSVKIAADGLSTRLWDRDGALGLQREHDIELLVNLNKPLLDDDALVSFFEQLLFRRMLSCEGRLNCFINLDSPGSSLNPDFIQAFFGDRATFELLVRGTEGRMRLFLQCLRQIAHETNFLLDEPWSEELVLAVIRSRATHELDDLQYVSPAVRMLLTRIKPAVVANNSRVFSISYAEYDACKDHLRELLSKGLLQPDVPMPERIPAVADLIAFGVSEDLMFEWHRALTFAQEVQALVDGELPPPAQPTLEELRIHLVDDPTETPMRPRQ
jgi:hypothetical protein